MRALVSAAFWLSRAFPLAPPLSTRDSHRGVGPVTLSPSLHRRSPATPVNECNDGTLCGIEVKGEVRSTGTCKLASVSDYSVWPATLRTAVNCRNGVHRGHRPRMLLTRIKDTAPLPRPRLLASVPGTAISRTVERVIWADACGVKTGQRVRLPDPGQAWFKGKDPSSVLDLVPWIAVPLHGRRTAPTTEHASAALIPLRDSVARATRHPCRIASSPWRRRAILDVPQASRVPVGSSHCHPCRIRCVAISLVHYARAPHGSNLT